MSKWQAYMLLVIHMISSSYFIHLFLLFALTWIILLSHRSIQDSGTCLLPLQSVVLKSCWHIVLTLQIIATTRQTPNQTPPNSPNISLFVSLHCCLFLFQSVSDVLCLQPHCSRAYCSVCMCVFSLPFVVWRTVNLITPDLGTDREDTSRYRKWKGKEARDGDINRDRTNSQIHKKRRDRQASMCGSGVMFTLNILSSVCIFTLIDKVMVVIWFLASCINHNLHNIVKHLT